MEVIILAAAAGGVYLSERRFRIVERFILALRLRRRIILYHAMYEEMEALRRDLHQPRSPEGGEGADVKAPGQ